MLYVTSEATAVESEPTAMAVAASGSGHFAWKNNTKIEKKLKITLLLLRISKTITIIHLAVWLPFYTFCCLLRQNINLVA